jgi:hypothetical protein
MKLLHALRSNFIDTHLFSQFAQALKGDLPIDLGIEGVILPYAHVVPGMDLGAFLPNQDIAGADNLAAISLDPKSLPRAVPAVSGAPSRFFVCHARSSPSKIFVEPKILENAPLRGTQLRFAPSVFNAMPHALCAMRSRRQAVLASNLYVLYFDLRKLLPVTDLFPVAFPPFELEGDYLLGLTLAGNAAFHFGIVQVRLPNADLLSVGRKNNSIKGDRIPCISRDFLHHDAVTRCYPVLLAP